MDEKRHPPRRAFLFFLLVLVPTLLFLGWSQASLNLSFIRPTSAQQTILLLAVSTFIVLAFVIFALILSRILLKLYVERRQQQLGARFKTKMVAAFLGLSLVPVCFLFIFAYGLLNRSIDKWFGIPFDIVRKNADEIVQELELHTEQRTLRSASHLATSEEIIQTLGRQDGAALERLLARQVEHLGLATALCFDSRGRLLARAGDSLLDPSDIAHLFPGLDTGRLPARGVSVRWRSADTKVFLVARPAEAEGRGRLGTFVSVMRIPLNIQRIAEEIQREAQKYDQLSRERKSVKRTYVSMLLLLTLLILFVATWFALFLAKQVTVPIQALAQATHEVSRGNLGFQVSARADDELGALVQSFNAMIRQLQESRQAIEQAARDLQSANRELERHANTIEAILENIPTGVISLDPQGEITQVNSTVERIFGREGLKSARHLSDLFAAEDVREITRLFRRAARQGIVTRQMDLDLGTRRAIVALTVTSIRARHGTVGSVLVLEDLTELLRAQKAAAWQEVAQRIAHEIKNPLTPILLSTERIRRMIEKAGPAPEGARTGPNAPSQDLLATVTESASLIAREVAALKTLVDEFSNFARFPASQPVPSSLNTIVEKALKVFDGRLNGIQLHTELASELPSVQADPEQMKRAVVNLIDNAAQALEQSATKEIWVRTALDNDRDVIELVVADSGPGIPADARERLFLPYFSTKRRGTGLGLAIVSRIVSEHHGSIRVEENRPTGAKFVIELPVDRAAVEPAR